jgi:drug/metabolite transporter (DMT)-like permease
LEYAYTGATDAYTYICLYSAIFASIFLKERLGSIGKIGCLLSVVGAFIVVLHAPEDKDVTSIDELLFYALQPGNMMM